MCVGVDGLWMVATCEVQTEEGAEDGVARTGEARADEGETEGSVSNGMGTSGTSTGDTSKPEGHGSARAGDADRENEEQGREHPREK